MAVTTKPKVAVRYKRTYGKERSVNVVEYEHKGERYITGTVVRGTDKSLGWYFGKGAKGLKEANRIALLPDEEFSKVEDDKRYLWKETLKRLTTELTPVTPEVAITLDPQKLDSAYTWLKANIRGAHSWGGLRQRVYDYEVEGLSVAEVSKIPFSQRISPPSNWNVPPEYAVAYFRIQGGATKAEAIKRVETDYLPALQKVAIPKAEVVPPEPKIEKAQSEYKELMKPRLEAHDKEIKVVNDEFMAGEMTSREMEQKHKKIHAKTDAVAATMRRRVWGKYAETLPSRAELEKVQRMRSSRSQSSDLARKHSVVISPDNPKVADWLHDQGTADISGIDTPSISKKVTLGSKRVALGRKGSSRVTPKTPRLRR